MITNILLTILYLTVKGFLLPLTLLPDATLPSGLTSAVYTAGGYISAIADIVPITSIILVLVAIIAVENGAFLIKILNWIIRKIPGIN